MSHCARVQSYLWGYDYPYMITSGLLNEHPRAGMAFSNASEDRGKIVQFYDLTRWKSRSEPVQYQR